MSRDLRVNHMIRVPQVRVVDEDGAQLGVMPTGDALRLAQDRGYDLVEVAPTASPPVVKLLDFGQYKYELAKREKEAKRRSRSVEFKEIRLKPKIGTGDFDTKVNRAIQFLEEGDRIKVTVQFRGRELTHPEIGRSLLARFTDRVKDHGVLERAPLLEGRAMHIVIASSHKPKTREPGAVAPAATDEKAPEPAAGAPAKTEETPEPAATVAAPAKTEKKPKAAATVAAPAKTEETPEPAATVAAPAKTEETPEPAATVAAPAKTEKKPKAAATVAAPAKTEKKPKAAAAAAAPATAEETPVAAAAAPAEPAAPAPTGE